MKRIVLFVLTNLAIMLVLGIVAQVLGIDRMLQANGSNLGGLLLYSALFGMGGSFISLAISKWMAKRSMGVQVIEKASNPTEQWLLDTVRAQAQRAGIGMPEVGIFESPQPNAFATGASRNNALVAVSTGLLRNMRSNEVEAVLAHEIAHVANGDMVTLTLIQGVLNTFVIFFARIIGNIIDKAIFRSDNERGGMASFFITMFVQMVLGVLASIIVMWFSRQREFRADAGGASFAGRDNMIAALERLKVGVSEPLPDNLAAFGISGSNAVSRMFMSHPPLDERIAALRAARSA
jgi:heat shock protein HtpX